MDANHVSAILFPGQGVGDASSRDLVAAARPDLLDLATELVGEDPFERISEGTAYAQPAVYCASIAGYEQLGRPRAEYFAGHSLGGNGATSWRRLLGPVSPAACSPSVPITTARRPSWLSTA